MVAKLFEYCIYWMLSSSQLCKKWCDLRMPHIAIAGCSLQAKDVDTMIGNASDHTKNNLMNVCNEDCCGSEEEEVLAFVCLDCQVVFTHPRAVAKRAILLTCTCLSPAMLVVFTNR